MISHTHYRKTINDNAIRIKQSLLDEHPNQHKNRMQLDNITEQINKLALNITDKVEYEKAVDYILYIIADITLPNTIDRSNLEFELFRLRYFYWAEHELKNRGIRFV